MEWFQLGNALRHSIYTRKVRPITYLATFSFGSFLACLVSVYCYCEFCSARMVHKPPVQKRRQKNLKAYTVLIYILCLKTLKSPRDGVKYTMVPRSFDVKERAAYKANAIFAVRVQYFP